jgi:hypothetical protein
MLGADGRPPSARAGMRAATEQLMERSIAALVEAGYAVVLSAMDCSITQRCTPRPEPCSMPRRAITGVIPARRTCLRYLSWS